MENPRPEKVGVVAEVREKFAAADAAVLTEYRGLNVAAMAELRRALRDAGGEYKIYKNTLVRFAARELGLEIDDLLVGPTAVAFVSGDAVSVAKALRDFARTNPQLVVKGSLLGDKVLDADRTRALADVAPREELLARLAGGIAAPMVQFAGLLQALPRNFAYGLKALIEQGGAPGAPAPAAEAPAEEAPAAEAPEAEAPAAETEAPEAEAEATEAEAPAEAAGDAEPETESESAIETPAEDSATDTPAESAPESTEEA